MSDQNDKDQQARDQEVFDNDPELQAAVKRSEEHPEERRERKPRRTGIPGENGWDEKPSAEQLGLTGDDGEKGELLQGEVGYSEILVSAAGPTPEDEKQRNNRTVTIVDPKVRGLAFVVAATEGNGLETQRIDYRDVLQEGQPFRHEGIRVVTHVKSFLEELNRKELSDRSTLWASTSRSLVSAIYNDHTTSTPGSRDDVLSLKLVRDEDWVRWHDVSGKFFGQEDFSDMIEELLHTVIEPDHADLMEVIESVRVSVGSEFESAIRRSDGQQTLSYREDTKTTAGVNRDLEIPQTIKLLLRPWESADIRYEVNAWFRTRVVNGQLKLSIKLKPTRAIELAAWADLQEKIADFTGKPVYLTE